MSGSTMPTASSWPRAPAGSGCMAAPPRSIRRSTTPCAAAASIVGWSAVQWALVDHPPGAGGFCCVPGSHKAAFELPAEPHPALMEDVALRAGDVMLFTEALTHATIDWQGPRTRRTLLYKYSPGSSTWADETQWPAELLDQLTDRQKLLLQPPSVAYHRPVV